jgi:pilus assembly protein FimV
VIAACIALMPFAVQAAGLGRLSVISGLGEPLNAEIELLSTSPEELSSLTAVIASTEVYAAQGIERTFIHGSIRVEPSKKADGTPILKLTTQQAVSDPFLDMLIQVDWPTGRLLREYTALLDPPGYSAATDSNSSMAMPSSPVVKPMPVKPSAQEKKTARKSKAVAVITPEIVSNNVPTDELETKRGDTLRAIARQLQVEGVSLDQMLVGLYRTNKDAFFGNNMNRLKVGQIIRAPSAEELQAITRQEASSEVRVQTADWNAYRNKLAGIAAEAPAAIADTGNQSSGGKLTAAAEDKAAPASSGPRDVVRLSKSDNGSDSTNKVDAKAMQDKLTALQEEGAAREKSIKEANERIVTFEKQIADMQKLLTVQNQAIAELQKNAGAAATTPKAEVANPAPAKGTVTKPAVAPATPTAAVEESGLLDGILAGIGDNVVLLGGGIVLLGGAWLLFRNKRKHNLDNLEQGILTAGELKANTALGNTSGDTVDTGDTSFLTDFSQNPDGIIDTHDVDAIAEAEVYIAYGREAQAEEILKDAIAKEPTQYKLHLKLLEIYATRNDPSAFGAVSGELYSTLGASDPVWAKVAEMGHKMEPDNPLYDTSSAPAAAVATAVATTRKFDVSDFDNTKVVSEPSLDFSLDADIAEPEQVSSLDSDLAASTTLPMEESATGLKMPESDLTAAVPSVGMGMEDSPLDFPKQTLETQSLETQSSEDLTLDSKTAEITAQSEVAEFGKILPGAEVMSLDMPEIGAEISVSTVDMPQEIAFEVAPEEVKPKEDDGLDFNFDMSTTEDAPAIQAPEADVSQPETNEATEIDLSGISLDLDTAPNTVIEENVAVNEAKEEIASAGDESEDVNTKLDLVTAYIDMGDKEGARELLDEVLKEGGARQRERAQQILNSLA